MITIEDFTIVSMFISFIYLIFMWIVQNSVENKIKLSQDSLKEILINIENRLCQLQANSEKTYLNHEWVPATLDLLKQVKKDTKLRVRCVNTKLLSKMEPELYFRKYNLLIKKGEIILEDDSTLVVFINNTKQFIKIQDVEVYINKLDCLNL